MSNRDWQRVSQVLAVLLVVLVGVAAIVVVTRPSSGPGGPTPSPTLTALASAGRSPAPSGSPSPGASASPVPSPSDSTAPSPSPSIEPSASLSPSPEISPSPSSSASLTPTAPGVAIRFRALGFDSTSASPPVARTITFKTDGPGEVAAHLARTSAGNVRLCLARRNRTPTCAESNKIDLVDSTDAPGRSTWTVTGVGTDASSPSADLRIVFRSLTPSVTLDGFRLQGIQNPGYNGVEADLDVNSGTVHAEGTWDSPQIGWSATLTDPATSETLGNATGHGTDLLLDAAVTATTPRRVHLSLINTDPLADQSVILHAVINWP